MKFQLCILSEHRGKFGKVEIQNTLSMLNRLTRLRFLPLSPSARPSIFVKS